MPHPHERPGGPRPGNPHEVRSDPRVGVDFPVDVYSSDLPGALPGRTRDLSVAGMCVATASPFAFKSVRRVVLTLPDRTLQIEAQGQWQRDIASDGVVLTGLAFCEPNEDVVELLWDVVLERGKQLTRFLYAGSDLAGFGLEETMGLAQVTRVRDVPLGHWIYRQDADLVEEDSIQILVRGRVVLQHRVRGARDVPFERLGAGALIGGLPLTAGLPYGESAIADSDVRLLEIDARSYRYLLAAKPWLALRLAQAVNRVQMHRMYRLFERLGDRL